MSNILITGATGNIGLEVIRFLYSHNTSHTIFAGVRNIEKAKKLLHNYPSLEFVHFDFEDFTTFDRALQEIDTVFLLRPPHISDINTVIKPLISKINSLQISEIMFLSVQGVEKSKIIPHNKIEQIIRENELKYIFLRPSYFMQNLTTTLLSDITNKREILLPAGKAKFNWIDIENIGEIAAILLETFEEYSNKAYEITGLENENFESVTTLINKTITPPILYKNINPITFYRIKKQEGMSRGMIIVMILLHFLPRFQKEPRISNFYKIITGKNPTDLQSFIKREKHLFLS